MYTFFNGATKGYAVFTSRVSIDASVDTFGLVQNLLDFLIPLLTLDVSGAVKINVFLSSFNARELKLTLGVKTPLHRARQINGIDTATLSLQLWNIFFGMVECIETLSVSCMGSLPRCHCWKIICRSKARCQTGFSWETKGQKKFSIYGGGKGHQSFYGNFVIRFRVHVIKSQWLIHEL